MSWLLCSSPRSGASHLVHRLNPLLDLPKALDVRVDLEAVGVAHLALHRVQLGLEHVEHALPVGFEFGCDRRIDPGLPKDLVKHRTRVALRRQGKVGAGVADHRAREQRAALDSELKGGKRRLHPDVLRDRKVDGFVGRPAVIGVQVLPVEVHVFQHLGAAEHVAWADGVGTALGTFGINVEALDDRESLFELLQRREDRGEFKVVSDPGWHPVLLDGSVRGEEHQEALRCLSLSSGALQRRQKGKHGGGDPQPLEDLAAREVAVESNHVLALLTRRL